MTRVSTVIGGRGFIGTALVRHLQAIDHSVWVPERHCDWPTKRPMGTVYYCAGLTADYLANPQATLEAHVSLVEKVLRSANWDRLVYLSSTRLYDSFPAGSSATEDMPLPVEPNKPRHFYDLTKLLGENLCLTLGRGRAKVARLGCVYDFSPQATGFLPSVMAKVNAHDKADMLTLDSSPHFSRDYIHLDDTVRGLIDIATRGEHGIYNLASGHNLRNDELAAWVKTETGVAIRFTHETVVPPPAVVSMNRFRREFGWQPADFAKAARSWP